MLAHTLNQSRSATEAALKLQANARMSLYIV